MKITRRSGLEDVAAEVAKALASAGIEAVLTGGACASLYSKGEYQSSDLDFILQSVVTQRQLDTVMASIGFNRRVNRYEHAETSFFVEYPRGPLGIGTDIAIRPSEYRIGSVRLKLLSPTDSCRDRLAAFYHWSDRQSLATAAQIARHNKVNMRVIREWSSREGASDGFAEFEHLLRGRAHGSRTVRKPARYDGPKKRK